MYIYTVVCPYHVHNVKLTDFLTLRQLFKFYLFVWKNMLGFAPLQIFSYQCLTQANLSFSCASEYTSVLCSLLLNQVIHELHFLLAYPGSPCAVLWDWSNLTWFPKGSVAYSLRSICCVSKTLLKWTGTAERALNELLLCKRVTWHIIFMFILKSTFKNVLDFSVMPYVYRIQTHLSIMQFTTDWFYWRLLTNPQKQQVLQDL